MKKFLLVSLALILVFGFLGGCGGSGGEVEDSVERDAETAVQEEDTEAIIEEESAAVGRGVEVPRELEQMVDHFKNSGLKIGQFSEKSYDIIGASAGFGLEVEGQEIELYYYDPGTTDQETLNNLEKKHNPDATFAIVINGYYELAVALHPEQERIIEIFMSY